MHVMLGVKFGMKSSQSFNPHPLYYNSKYANNIYSTSEKQFN